MKTTYENCRKLIFKQVHSHRIRYGGDFDDLLSQANLIFCESYDAYRNRSEGMGIAFSTFLFTRLHYGLLDLKISMTKESKTVRVSSVIVDELFERGVSGYHHVDNKFTESMKDLNPVSQLAYYDRVDQIISFKDFIKSLSPDEKAVMDLIFSEKAPRRLTKNTLYKKLRSEEFNWTVSRAKYALAQLKADYTAAAFT